MEWKTIDSAPKDVEFYCKHPQNSDVLIKVKRYDNPFGNKNTVINNFSGQWFSPSHYIEIPESPK